MKILSICLHAFGEGRKQDAPDRRGRFGKPSFDELIKNDYRQEFTNRVSAILDRRLKNLNAELAAARPILEILRKRYDIADGPGAAEAIRKALEMDHSAYGPAAAEFGMTPAQFRRMNKAQADSKELRAMLAAQQTMQRKKEMFQQWDEQAAQLRKQYPGVDPREEMNRNPDFADLVRRGIDMLTAYQVCHQKEMLQQAAQQAETQTIARVRANRSRPRENGSGGTQPVRLRTDPSKWTREQFRDVERRAARGERIVL